MQMQVNFPSSTSRTVSKTITIPNLNSITSISVNNGNVSHTVNGDNVTITVSSGSGTRVQTGGSYTPSQSKTVSVTKGPYTGNTMPSSTSYNSGGYSGTLSAVDSDYRDGYIYVVYSGTVTKPAVDTRTYEYRYSYIVTVDYVDNTAPVISGSDQNLGDKNIGFSITYKVNDVDNNALTVTEKLNGTTLRTLNNPPKNQDIVINLTDEQIRALPIDSANTIQIKVDDSQGGISYRNYTFKRVNTAPVISGQDEELGQVTAPFSKVYSVTDIEGDSITITEKMDNKVIRTFEAVAGQEYTISIPENIWLTLTVGEHTLIVEAKDINGAISTRTYAFLRQEDKIKVSFKNPIKTDLKASKIIVTPTWSIPPGAAAKVEACNNGLDEIPTWEDMTEQVNLRKHYNFTNTTKTATDWGINVRITIEKGTATNLCILDGFGGAFE